MSFNDLSINKSIPVPLYYQLKELILGEIKSGNIRTGDPIPTEKELSQMFEISRTTIRQAIIELVQDGYLYRAKGKGTFVSKPKLNQDFMRKLETFNDQMKRLGLTPSTQVLRCTVTEATDDISTALDLMPKEKIVELVRLRLANDEPIVIVHTYLPYATCSSILQKDMEELSLYEVLSQSVETKICKVLRNVEAIVAGQYESNLLNIKKGYPIQFTKTIGYNNLGKPIEYSLARYRGDRNKFTIEIYI